MPKLCNIDIKHREKVYKKIDRFIKSLKRRLPVKKIYLHGSCARDELHEGSDVDMIIVGDIKGKMFERIEQVLKLTDLPIEPLVYTEGEFERLIKGRNSFILSVINKGKKV